MYLYIRIYNILFNVLTLRMTVLQAGRLSSEVLVPCANDPMAQEGTLWPSVMTRFGPC